MVFTRTNVLGTHVLLNCAKQYSVSKFIHMSTDEVYGSIDNGSFVESDQLNPSSPYSACKAAAELIAKGFMTTYKLPVVIARCSNAFGPYQYPGWLVPLSVKRLLNNEKIQLTRTFQEILI